MALSNLFDREDGVFFRFANDAQWENPERECTLEENAALVSLYVEAAHVFREDDFTQSAVRVLQFMLDKLRDPATGAFYGGFFAPEEYYRLPAAQRHTIDETCVDPVIHSKENALAAQAFLDAYRMTENAAYRDHATTVLEHLWRSMWNPAQGMARNWNGTAYGWGWLPDQTAAARAFVHAYETTGERKYLDSAQTVAEHILRVHHDPKTGGFWDSAPDRVKTSGGDRSQATLGLLAHRQEVMADTSAAAELLVRMWRLTNNEHYRTVAQDALANYAMTFRHFAHFGALYGQAVDRLLRAPTHVVVIGSHDSPAAQALFHQALRIHTPAQIIQWLDPEHDADLLEAQGIAAEGIRPEAMIYSGRIEEARATSPAELAAIFEQVEAAA